MGERPKPDYVTGDLTRAVRVASWVPVLASVGLLGVRYPGLPDEIATHFALDGTPNGWGPKWTLFVLLGVFLVLLVAVDVLSRRPRLFNYATKVTSENAQRLYREGERMMVGLQFALACTLLGLVLLGTGTDGAGNGVLWVSLALMAVVTVVGVVRMARAGRPVTP